jgi:hypothetical protein
MVRPTAFESSKGIGGHVGITDMIIANTVTGLIVAFVAA